MKFGVLVFLDCLAGFPLSSYLTRFFALRQGGWQLPDALPRMPRAGAGQVRACVRWATLDRGRTHLTKALSPQSFGSLGLCEAPSNELVIGAPS